MWRNGKTYKKIHVFIMSENGVLSLKIANY